MKPILVTATRGVSDLLTLYGRQLFPSNHEPEDKSASCRKLGRRLYQLGVEAPLDNLENDLRLDFVVDSLLNMLDDVSTMLFEY